MTVTPFTSYASPNTPLDRENIANASSFDNAFATPK